MSKMYIRVRHDGTIYEYDDILAKNPKCEVVAEEVAFPERFIPAHVEVATSSTVKAPRVKRKPMLDFATTDIPEPPPYTAPEVAADASRGLP